MTKLLDIHEILRYTQNDDSFYYYIIIMKLSRVIRISRPRFWIYELGPYMIGVLGAILTLNQLHAASISATPPRGYMNLSRYLPYIIFYWLYFLIPANIWIYGINDIYDYETDKLNPKKVEWYEALVTPKEQKSLWKRIIASTLPFLILLPFVALYIFVPCNSINIDVYGATGTCAIHTQEVLRLHFLKLFAPILISFLAFLFFSWQYSAKPIRAKARPILDSFFSAWHYITTAIFGYLLVNPTWDINRYYVIAGMARAIAMHAFSAVPDIQADKDAKLATIATLLWWKATIWACFGLYLLASILSYSFLWRVSIVLWIAYCGLMIWAVTLYGNEKKLFALYKRFPWINTVSGMILFFVVLLKIL